MGAYKDALRASYLAFTAQARHGQQITETIDRASRELSEATGGLLTLKEDKDTLFVTHTDGVALRLFSLARAAGAYPVSIGDVVIGRANDARDLESMLVSMLSHQNTYSRIKESWPSIRFSFEADR